MTQALNTQSLYERDTLLWAEDTVAKLRSRDFENVDLENVIEEIEALGKSQRNATKSFLRRLIEHLLKRCYVPLPECYIGWQREIRAFRNEIKDILEDSPSLKNFCLEIFPKVYANAIVSVREEYPQINFPDHWLEDCDINAILNRNFWEEN